MEEHNSEHKAEHSEHKSEHKPKEKFNFRKFYEKNYKKLLIMPILMLVLALLQIGMQTVQTGDFVNKGVSLKGGITLTIEKAVDDGELEGYLNDKYPNADIGVRSLSRAGEAVGVIVEASDTDDALVDDLIAKLELEEDQFSVETMGSSLGESFFKETFRIIILAFLFMGMVVFLYFGEDIKSKIIAITLTVVTMPVVYFSSNMVMYIFSLLLIGGLLYVYIKSSIPSFAVILAALSDIIITLSVVNIMGIKLGTAGIAAFLMLIGYSVDTDILLSTKVLKRKQGTVTDRIWNSMKTGLVMSATTLTAIIIALSFAQSDILKQIMTILLIGLIIDLPNTWIQNAGILKWHLEKDED